MKYLNRRGMSLVELLAAIVIMTIILTSFSLLLLSAARSTQQSRSVVDYTFIGQSKTEIVFEAVSSSTRSTIDGVMTARPIFFKSEGDPNNLIYLKEETDVNGRSYVVRVTFTDYATEDDQFLKLSSLLSNVVVEVTPDGASHPSAIIETVMEWGG
ncbi:prepilin-type N-terminal cleavage/methylation domain-containing protein [Psychrobacillus sp. L4]|uniref:type IV pilus modification PilV family protein n=1 Tax=Psychrobacillus sp. L4 TaxID=3236892 RepID=UPI0036F38F8E